MSHIYQPRSPKEQFFSWLMGLFGWKVILEPPQGKKYVLVGYPHTSNWDFLPALGWIWATGLRGSWVGKAQLFQGIMKPIMTSLGGIPVDRDKSKNFVQKVAELFATREELFLIIAAEGTRSRAEYWKTGFYYIALEAKVPLALAYMDWKRKEVGIGAYYMPTGDLETDWAAIRGFFQDKTGRDPSKQSPIRLKSEVEPE
ncbi:MAG: lysophospholipid acyltransferase family protein [Deinococcales bacterium]